MENMGTHLVVDAWQAPAELLNDPEAIREALIEAIAAGKATLIDLCVHQFSPHGVTATATLAEVAYCYPYVARTRLFCSRPVFLWCGKARSSNEGFTNGTASPTNKNARA